MSVESRKPYRFFLLLAALTLCLAGCMWGAATVPEIYLKQSDMTMTLDREAYGIEAMDLSRDGRHLLTGDNGGWNYMRGGFGTGRTALRLWDLSEGVQRLKLEAGETIISVALSPDRRYAVTGGFVPDAGPFRQRPFPPLKVWDLEAGRLHRTIGPFEGFLGNEFSSIQFSHDGSHFLATDWTSVYLFDARTWQLVKTLSPAGYSPPPIIPYKSFVAAFSPDGRRVLSGGPDAVLRLWDVESGREIRQFTGHKAGFLHGGISTVTFSRDGRYAATNAYNDGHVILWDVEKGTEVRRFSDFDSVMGMYFMEKSLSFSPDGSRLFVVGDTIWDVSQGRIATDLRYAWKGIQIAGRNPVSGAYHPDGRSVLMTMDDAAMRIYDARTGEEVAVLIAFADGEWLTITTEGYYNASEKGAQYLSVRVGETAYSVDRFYDVFYRPDIVAAKLRGEAIGGLVTITMKDAIRNPPPQVRIRPVTTPAGSPKATVCYDVTSAGGGIGEIRLFHNGKLVASDGHYREAAKGAGTGTALATLDGPAIHAGLRSVRVAGKGEAGPVTARAKGETFSECREVDAVAGENEASVAAFNRDNTIQGALQTVRFTAALPPAEPRLFVLAVGVDRYRAGGIDLKYAVKDAREVQARLLRQAETVYRPQNIFSELITDGEATKAGLLARIEALAQRITPADSFVLFVAGHGALLENQYYLLTHDYDGRGGGGRVSSNEIIEISKKIRSLNQLFIFDTCHAGGVDAIVRGLYDARMSVLARKMGLHIYASASDQQGALEGYRGNGLFTHTLLAGLENNRAADRKGDGTVTVVGLGDYARRTTQALAKEVGRNQTPLILHFGRDSVLYRLR